MIFSMTGYSRAQISESGYSVTVDMKSLNGRTLDVLFRFPKGFMYLESEARSIVRKHLRRGRIECVVTVDVEDPKLKAPPIQPDVFLFYWNQITDLARSIPNSSFPTLSDVLRIPYIYDHSKDEKQQELFSELLLRAVNEAVEKLVTMRLEEGSILEKACRNHLETIESIVESIEKRRDEVVADLRTKIFERMREILKEFSIDPDEEKIIQEVAFLAEKSDITEELVRLKGHISHFRKLLNADEAVDGRQLDFLVQEMHREATTLGNKSADLEISVKVVDLKAEIARLREQVQNIE
ncbi:MAG TPA: YicC family protein [Thermodesulforhabdus norvegica]|uniref:YicC family protein n=1 Tax=Thermodesulforhabdus norvegica TaxID=39841 RepID=A0A7C0WUL3_9BACT|nr:YicC family protein [Thermodesulforhabdus norvegica]